MLYRSSRTGRGQTHLTPRLVLCDVADAFGSMSSAGGMGGQPAEVSAAPAIDPLAWNGPVTEVVQEAQAAHAFVAMLDSTPIANEWGGHYAGTSAPLGGLAGGYGRAERSSRGNCSSSEDEEERRSDDGFDSGRPLGDQLGDLAISRSADRADEAGPPTRRQRRAAHGGAEAGGSADGADGGDGDGDGGGGGGGEDEELHASAFEFEASVRYWSDYLQAHS